MEDFGSYEIAQSTGFRNAALRMARSRLAHSCSTHLTMQIRGDRAADDEALTSKRAAVYRRLQLVSSKVGRSKKRNMAELLLKLTSESS